MPQTYGFEQTRERRIPELGAVLHEYTHAKSGARLCWLERADENKSFCAAFRTLPYDDSGVFHILEHSVLCGSEQFPVKEPFVELMKGSLNTFLNALTYPDKTCYPVSSRNDQDFLNLMHVYLDAVFFPRIHEKPEIFQQEGWHYELQDGVLTRSGVVLNEMKGSFADPDTLLANALTRALFPDTPYRFVSGRRPGGHPDPHLRSLYRRAQAVLPSVQRLPPARRQHRSEPLPGAAGQLSFPLYSHLPRYRHPPADARLPAAQDDRIPPPGRRTGRDPLEARAGLCHRHEPGRADALCRADPLRRAVRQQPRAAVPGCAGNGSGRRCDAQLRRRMPAADAPAAGAELPPR